MQNSTSDFTTWSRRHLEGVEAALDSLLPLPQGDLARLREAMRYATLSGGKRIRALLCVATAELFGLPAEPSWQVAAAIEMIHAYSLVHDDLPCMDDDALRRGRPTVHVQYDEALAMLVGDGLQTRAFEVLTDAGLGLAAAQQLALVRILAAAAGPDGMVGGQAIDIAHVGCAMTIEQLENMHRRKTGALIRAAVEMGGIAAGASDSDCSLLGQFGSAVGLAFQVVDDILDVTASTETLGKTAGKDADADKPTYVSLLGMTAARALAARLQAQAEAALTQLPGDGSRLRALAALIVERCS